MFDQLSCDSESHPEKYALSLACVFKSNISRVFYNLIRNFGQQSDLLTFIVLVCYRLGLHWLPCRDLFEFARFFLFRNAGLYSPCEISMVVELLNPIWHRCYVNQHMLEL
jgi:hypothetical protein